MSSSISIDRSVGESLPVSDASLVQSDDFSCSSSSRASISAGYSAAILTSATIESTAIEDIDLYVKLKQNEMKPEVCRAKDTEQVEDFVEMIEQQKRDQSIAQPAAEQQTIANQDSFETLDDDDSWVSTTSSNDTFTDDESTNNPTSEREREMFEEARARMLVLQRSNLKRKKNAKFANAYSTGIGQDKARTHKLVELQLRHEESSSKLVHENRIRLEEIYARKLKRDQHQKHIAEAQPRSLDSGFCDTNVRTRTFDIRKQKIRDEILQSRQSMLNSTDADGLLSVSTGKSPTTPIDVTKADDIAFAQPGFSIGKSLPCSILERVNYTISQREEQEHLERTQNLERARKLELSKRAKQRALQEKLACESALECRESRCYKDICEIQDRNLHHYQRDATTTRAGTHENYVTRVISVSPRSFSDGNPERKERLKRGVAVPLVIPQVLYHDDDVSTIGGSLKLYNKMMNMLEKGLERDADPVRMEAAMASSDSERHKGFWFWLAARSDLEVFFIFVIVVAMVTLIVLFVLILVKKA